MTDKLLAAIAATLIRGTASAAFASDAPTVFAQATSTRGNSGFLFEASGSVMVLNMSGGCGCRAPGTPERSWETYPVVNLRLGYAF